MNEINEINEKLKLKSKWDINLVSDSYEDLVFFSKKKPYKTKKKPYIDQDLVKMKYQHMEIINNIKGFIVNVHGPTDFDIDIQLPNEISKKYENIIFHEYIYEDINIESSYDIKSSIVTKKQGKAFRCRLKGIGTKKPNKSFLWKSNQLLIEIKHLIDRTDGWVRCNLLDIDIYQRLLIDIFIDTQNGSINLKDYLLNRMNFEIEPIFFEYIKTQ